MEIFLLYVFSVSADLRLKSRGCINPAAVSHLLKSAFTSDSNSSFTFCQGLLFFLSNFSVFLQYRSSCYLMEGGFVIFLFDLFGSKPNFPQSTIPALLVIAEIRQYFVGYWQLHYFLLLNLLYRVFQFVKHRFPSICMYLSNLVSIKAQLKTFN